MLSIPVCSVFSVFLFAVSNGLSQEINPVSWHFTLLPTGTDGKVIFKSVANINPGWHLYSHSGNENGPMSVMFHFTDKHIILTGPTAEQGNRTEYFDPVFETDVSYYADTVHFLQRCDVTGVTKKLQGYVTYMTCNEEMCVPCKQYFSLDVRKAEPRQ